MKNKVGERRCFYCGEDKQTKLTTTWKPSNADGSVGSLFTTAVCRECFEARLKPMTREELGRG